MNIFYLDENIEKCAQYHCDKHVVKMMVEYAQILSTVCRLNGIDEGYKITHKNHPCVKWANSSLSNWIWLKELSFELSLEYLHRYNKIHKSWEVIEKLSVPKINDIGITKLPRCMPDEYKKDCVIESYRNYYIFEKNSFAKWKNREVPFWFKIGD